MPTKGNSKTNSKASKMNKMNKMNKVKKVVKSVKLQKAGSTKKTVKKTPVKKVVVKKTTVKKTQEAGASKTNVKAVAKKTVDKKTVDKKTVDKKTVDKTVTKSQVKQTAGVVKKVRSFKVRLPGYEAYQGRFTGLTPYQAANKALSKYYRETEKPQPEITFSIKESTRGSKRSTYTYDGRREKLDVPVEYAIQDGRIITKNFKNFLTKVKKVELANRNLEV